MRSLLVVVLCCLLIAGCAEGSRKNTSSIQIQPLGLEVVWDQALHNAFTDLIRYKGDFYLTFREGLTHISQIGRIRVLRSSDGIKWDSVALFENQISPTEIGDLRDAKFSITPSGDLMLMGASVDYGVTEDLSVRQNFVTFSTDGTTWSPIQFVGDTNKWIWRATWHNGTAYGISYNTGPLDPGTDLYESSDGINWTVLLADMRKDFKPTEATIRFVDDTAYAIQRRDAGTALLGSADPPYTDWTWTDLGVSVEGHQFILDPSGHWIGAGRLNVGSNRTFYFHVDLEKRTVAPLLRAPSGKDNSYCGLLHYQGVLWMSYYSDHEDKAKIYMTRGRVITR